MVGLMAICGGLVAGAVPPPGPVAPTVVESYAAPTRPADDFVERATPEARPLAFATVRYSFAPSTTAPLSGLDSVSMKLLAPAAATNTLYRFAAGDDLRFVLRPGYVCAQTAGVDGGMRWFAPNGPPATCDYFIPPKPAWRESGTQPLPQCDCALHFSGPVNPVVGNVTPAWAQSSATGSVGFALGLAPTPTCDLPPAASHETKAAAKLVIKVYGVEDILGGEPATDAQAETARRERLGGQLQRLVQGVVRPYTWEANGGLGATQFYAIGNGLVVHAAPDVQGEVTQLLESLRRLNPPRVAGRCDCTEPACELAPASPRPVAARAFAVRYHVVILPAGEVKKLIPESRVMTADETERFLKAAQGVRLGNVVTMPWMRAVEGKPMKSFCGGPPVDAGSKLAAMPAHVLPMTHAFESRVTFRPERDAIHLEQRYNYVAPKPAPGATFPSVDHLSDDPAVRSRAAAHDPAGQHEGSIGVNCLLASGSTYAYPLGAVGEVLPREPTGIARLFGKGSPTPVKLEGVLMITVKLDENKPDDAATPAGSTEAAKLVAEYKRACAAGDRDRATRLAIQALALDSACFSGAAGK